MTRTEPVRSGGTAFAEAAPPRPRGTPPRGAWLGLFLVALAARLAFVAVMPAEIAWPDGREYDAIARSLTAGDGYGLQTLRPPAYPTFMAGVYALTGGSLLALRVVEALLGACAALLLGLAGARLFFPWAGFVAGALAALHPVLAFMPATQYSENFLVLVLIGAIALLLLAARGEARGGWLLSGALFGVAVLTRPNVVLLLPGLAIGALVLMRRGARPWLAAAAGFVLALELDVAPWVIRNHEVHGRWYFVATGGGRQFWIGNNPRATGATTVSVWPDSAQLAHMATLPDDLAREQYLYGVAREWVSRHPGEAARLWWIKLGNLFALWPETYSRTRWMSEASRWAQGAASIVIFAGALASVASFRRRPELWALAAAVVGFALVNALFFSVMRYRLAFEPCLLWMAGVGWTEGIRDGWFARRRA